MNHLFAGINADYLRTEPYIPAFFKTNSMFASDVGIEINKDAHIIMAPNIGSYVGGDITAGALVSMIWNRPEFSLFIDLALDRQNAKLDDFYNPHHEAILRMIQMVVDNAHKCGKWAGICGELGADATLTEQFVRMGVDELSVAPSMILKLRKIVREMKKVED